MRKHLVIGMGEVGKAIYRVLGDGPGNGENIYSKDIEQSGADVLGRFDVLHICFPWSKNFIQYVKEYKILYTPSLIIIHSTVPIGTSSRLDAVHSPVRGVHPYLYEGIKTFQKFFGGRQSDEAAMIFQDCGIPTTCGLDAEETEAIKLWDTTYYGWNILFEKFVHDWCEKNGVRFDIVYTIANETYNTGYKELGMGHVRRPVLKHRGGKIGGHCVIPNAHLLDSEIAKYLVEQNEKL